MSATVRVRERVVAHRLERIGLHQRDVLVRGRMEHDSRPVLLEHLAHLGPVARVREHGRSRMELALVDELALDLEQARLAVVHENEPRGAHARDLAAELGADGAACAGHENDLPGEIARDRLQIRVNGLAPEQILHLDRPDLAGEIEVSGDELVQGRQRVHRHGFRARHRDDPLAHVARGGGNRDEQLVRAPASQERRELVRGAEDANAVEPEVLLARVVVHEPDGRVAERRVAQHLPEDQLGRVTGADDEHFLATRHERARGRSLDDRPREQAHAHDEGEQQEQVDDPDATRDRRGMEVEDREDDEGGDHGDRSAAQHSPHVLRRDVAPPAVVEAEGDEDREHDPDHEDDDVPLQVAVVVHGPVAVEADVPREHPRGGDQRGIDRDLP